MYSQTCTDVSDNPSVSYQMLGLTEHHCKFKVLYHVSQRGHGYLQSLEQTVVTKFHQAHSCFCFSQRIKSPGRNIDSDADCCPEFWFDIVSALNLPVYL